MGSSQINDALQFRGPFPRAFALGKHHRNHSGRLRRRAFLSDVGGPAAGAPKAPVASGIRPAALVSPASPRPLVK